MKINFNGTTYNATAKNGTVKIKRGIRTLASCRYTHSDIVRMLTDLNPAVRYVITDHVNIMTDFRNVAINNNVVNKDSLLTCKEYIYNVVASDIIKYH